MSERNIANVAHDLKPLLRSLRNKLSLLKEAHQMEYQKIMKQIKLDVTMTEKYSLAIEHEVKDLHIQMAKVPPKCLANVVLHLVPLAKSLSSSVESLENVTRSSDYVRALRKVNDDAECLEKYVQKLDEEAQNHDIEKAKGIAKLHNIEI